MKKSYHSLALALLGAMAGGAYAQTAVTIYGIADAGLVNERGGATGNVNKLTSGAQSGSRLGFRGREDLGGGLGAIFTLEAGIALDTGGFNQNNTAFGRQAFVGVDSSTIGAVTLGRQYTAPYLILRDIADPFAVGFAGNSLNLIPAGGSRMNNSIKYASPSFYGVSGEAAYGFGEVAGSNTANRIVNAAIGYGNGPINVRAGYFNRRNPTNTGGFRNILVGASWDFRVAKAHLAYGVDKGLGSSPFPVGETALPFGTPAGLGSDDSREWLVGVTVPFGPATFLASYIRKDDRSGFNADARQWAVGATYSVSKRTNFYTSYGSINNDAGASFTVGNASEAGSGDRAFNIGVRHLF
ncbi:MAG: hypothetical protein JWQ23_670 [Herminiimonas sp.]|nr:hypothetical protein [Herminiimonas sp.]